MPTTTHLAFDNIINAIHSKLIPSQVCESVSGSDEVVKLVKYVGLRMPGEINKERKKKNESVFIALGPRAENVPMTKR